MKYSIKQRSSDDICVIRVEGEHRRPDDSMQLQDVARSYRQKHGCSRFLFDMRAADIKGGITAAYQTATAPMGRIMQPYDYAVALAYTGEMREHRFMELVAMNRGYRLKVFDNLDEGLHWLRDS